MQLFKNKSIYFNYVILLIIVSTIFRALIASIVELGNDEVYYRIFALFPQLSYFDHPPLLSQIIRLTTFASEAPDEFFIRLSSIIIGAINTYLIYKISQQPIFDNLSENPTNELQRQRRGLFAALLYTGSLYASVIVGIFIMPDTPLSLFWLLTLYYFTQILSKKTAEFSHKKMLLAGFFIGLAMLSKYSGLYMWGAAGLYILLCNRSVFKKWSLYVAPILSILVFSPVLIWNYDNDFISFTFHGSRIVANNNIEWLYFGREIFGGIFYNNPINFILIITSLVAYFLRKRHYISSDALRFLLCFSLPIILLFLSISLTRETLPHWAAPGYFALMILAASYLTSIKAQVARRWLKTSVIFISVVLIAGALQINTGLFMGSTNQNDPTTLGNSDVTLDMYGWEKFEQEFANIYNKDIEDGIMPSHNAVIYSSVWYEAAHLDCYVALPNNLKLKTIAAIDDSHLYHWITEWRGGIQKSESGYLIASSRYYHPNSLLFKELGITKASEFIQVPILRGEEIVEYFFIYRINPIK